MYYYYCVHTKQMINIKSCCVHTMHALTEQCSHWLPKTHSLKCIVDFSCFPLCFGSGLPRCKKIPISKKGDIPTRPCHTNIHSSSPLKRIAVYCNCAGIWHNWAVSDWSCSQECSPFSNILGGYSTSWAIESPPPYIGAKGTIVSRRLCTCKTDGVVVLVFL